MKPRPISIVPVLNGFLVQVGCQQVVMTSITDLADGIRDYYKDPTSVERWFLANKRVNNTLEDQPVCEPAAPSQSYGECAKSPEPTSAGCDAPRSLMRR